MRYNSSSDTSARGAINQSDNKLPVGNQTSIQSAPSHVGFTQNNLKQERQKKLYDVPPPPIKYEKKKWKKAFVWIVPFTLLIGIAILIFFILK